VADVVVRLRAEREVAGVGVRRSFVVLRGGDGSRQHDQAKHGAATSLKEFHESALRQGAVPLPALDRLLQ